MKTKINKVSFFGFTVIAMLTVFFSAPNVTRAGEVLVPFIDPLTGLVIADAFSCAINVIWGCDSNGNPLPPPPPPAPTEGKCGWANGRNFLSPILNKPPANYYVLGDKISYAGNGNGVDPTVSDADLCSAGSVNWISMAGPYIWECVLAEKKTASCGADIAGVCGPANGDSYTTNGSLGKGFNGGYCFSGSMKNFTGSGPWSWTCEGTHSYSLYQDASCKANVYATCGDSGSNTATFSVAPTDNLCNGGVSIAPPSHDHYVKVCTSPTRGGCRVPLKNVLQTDINFWYWTCSAPGSPNYDCRANSDNTASAAAVNGACGATNGSIVASLNVSDPFLCVSGSTVSNFSGAGPWNWECDGSNGGYPASCTANKTCTPDGTYTCPSGSAIASCDGTNAGQTIITNKASCFDSCGNSKLNSVCISNGVSCADTTKTCPTPLGIDKWREVAP